MAVFVVWAEHVSGQFFKKISRKGTIPKKGVRFDFGGRRTIPKKGVTFDSAEERDPSKGRWV